MLPTAGVSMSAPCGVSVTHLSQLPVFAVLNVIRWLVGSIVEILSWSTTRTGKPETVEPCGPNAYTCLSIPAMTTSSGPPAIPSRFASTGELMNPCWVRSKLGWRTFTNGSSGLSEKAGLDSRLHRKWPLAFQAENLPSQSAPTTYREASQDTVANAAVVRV